MCLALKSDVVESITFVGQVCFAEGKVFLQKKAMASYGEVKVQAGVAYADGVRLTQMLYDGLCDTLATAEGHMSRGAVAEKGESVNRALKILFGLQGTLDFDRGGEVARTLNDLYSYSVRRIVEASATNDLAALQEVRGHLEQIRVSWATLPASLEAGAR